MACPFLEDECELPETLSIAYRFDGPHTFKKVSSTLLKSGDSVSILRKFQNTSSMLPVDACGKLSSLVMSLLQLARQFSSAYVLRNWVTTSEPLFL